MELLEVMKQRHSVRRYTDKVIEKDIRIELERCIEEVNAESVIPSGFELAPSISEHLNDSEN